jgi:hypothetical protein
MSENAFDLSKLYKRNLPGRIPIHNVSVTPMLKFQFVATMLSPNGGSCESDCVALAMYVF